MTSRTILVVDDDDDLRDTLVEQLSLYEEFDVLQEATAAKGIAAARGGLVDLLIMDVGLPDMPGTQVYRHIAREHPQLPVIFSTGHGDPALLEPYLAVPHVALLRKPYDTATLLEALEKVLHAADRSRRDSPRIP